MDILMREMSFFVEEYVQKQNQNYHEKRVQAQHKHLNVKQRSKRMISLYQSKNIRKIIRLLGIIYSFQ